MTPFIPIPSVYQVATGNDLSPKFLRDIAELLGIPPKGLKSLRVTLDPDTPIIVEATYYVVLNGQPVIDAATQTFKEEAGRWELVRIE